MSKELKIGSFTPSESDVMKKLLEAQQREKRKRDLANLPEWNPALCMCFSLMYNHPCAYCRAGNYRPRGVEGL